ASAAPAGLPVGHRGRLGPDGELVAGRVAEVEPSPAGEVERLGDDLAAGGPDGLDARVQVGGEDDEQRSAGPHLGGEGEPADLPVAVAPDADVVGAGAVVVEAPAEGPAVELLGGPEV